MKAFRCDRCREYYIPYAGVGKNGVDRASGEQLYNYNFNAIRLIKSGSDSMKGDNYDLCPKCAEELINWVKRRERTNENNRS